MNLFCSADHLAAWHVAHPTEPGRAVCLDQAADIGRAEWGRLVEAQCCE
jgi:hypothetical protein